MNLNRYSYQSEQEVLVKEFTNGLNKHQDLLIEYYIRFGFNELVEFLRLKNEWQKDLLFEYLIVDQKVLLTLVKRFKGFFLDLISKGNGSVIRTILGIKSKKYNQEWKEVLDYLSKLYESNLLEKRLLDLSSESFFHVNQRFFKHLGL